MHCKKNSYISSADSNFRLLLPVVIDGIRSKPGTFICLWQNVHRESWGQKAPYVKNTFFILIIIIIIQKKAFKGQAK